MYFTASIISFFLTAAAESPDETQKRIKPNSHQTRCAEEWEHAGGDINKAQGRKRHQWAIKCGVINEEKLRGFKIFAGDDNFISFMHLDGYSLAPFDDNAPCDPPGTWKPMNMCPYGCVEAAQRVLMDDQWMTLPEAYASGVSRLSTLSPDSSPSQLAITSGTSIATYTSGPEPEDLLVLTLSNGMTASVTRNHPMVGDTGNIQRADKLILGDALMTLEGPASVVRIQKMRSAEDVWNVLPESREALANTMVVEGIVTGSLRFQNEWADHAYRHFVKEAIDPVLITSFSSPIFVQ